jgi:hypothetical protein
VLKFKVELLDEDISVRGTDGNIFELDGVTFEDLSLVHGDGDLLVLLALLGTNGGSDVFT